LKTNKFIRTLLAVVGFSAFSFGQQTLSAKDAVLRGLENNFNVQIAKSQEEIAARNNRWSEAGLFPTVTFSATFSNGIQDNTNNPFTFTPGIILSQGLNPSLSANWNLFSGMAVLISKERLEQLEVQSKGNTVAVMENTVQDILKAYYTAVLQKKRLNLYNELITTSRKRVKYYELKEKYAQSSSLEMLQFKNQYLTDSTNALIQEVSYQNALRNLEILMNVPQDENRKLKNYVLTDSLNVQLLDLDLNQAKTELLSNNQNIKNQYIALELQKTAVDYQRSFLYPTLSLQGAVTPSYNWLRNLQNTNQEFQTQVLTYSGNLNLRYNIFNNWKTKRAVEVAKIQEEIAYLNTKSMEVSLTANLENLVDLYRSRMQLVSISEENLVYATKIWELAQKRFELGAINSIELSSVQNTYQNTLIQHFENLYNRFDTYIELLKITGKFGLQAN
jgi:outer membrane protein TolC